MQTTIERQENYGKVINIAGSQTGISNRIAFFVVQMASATTQDDFEVARQQLGRAVNLMRRQHDVLLHGDPESHIPQISTPLLTTVYFEPAYGLDRAIRAFLDHAAALSKREFGDIERNNPDYVYVVVFGPYVLDTLLDAAVSEYERFVRAEIETLKRNEFIAVGLALLLLVVEALFIFRPLESRIREAFRDLREAQVRLSREKKAAEEANASKTDFLSNMSHELRTPLNAVIGFSECLEAGIYGPIGTQKQLEVIQTIRRSGAHLLRLVNDTLDLSAAEAGAIVLDETHIDIFELLKNGAILLSPLAEQRGVTLVAERSSVPLRLRADERRVQQILINLLNNAIKFSPEGATVRVRPEIKTDGRAGFVVEDNGIGMTPEEITRAKERFGQAGNVLTRRQQGTGLGIPVAIELARCHGGAIYIASEISRGTVVTVLFPRDRAYGRPPIQLNVG